MAKKPFPFKGKESAAEEKSEAKAMAKKGGKPPKGKKC